MLCVSDRLFGLLLGIVQVCVLLTEYGHTERRELGVVTAHSQDNLTEKKGTYLDKQGRDRAIKCLA